MLPGVRQNKDVIKSVDLLKIKINFFSLRIKIENNENQIQIIVNLEKKLICYCKNSSSIKSEIQKL